MNNANEKIECFDTSSKNNRLKLGILFYFNPSWMGGIIYILNIIKALDFLDDHKKPEIFLFYHPKLNRFVDEIDYPYLHAIERIPPKIYVAYIKSFILRRNIFVNDILSQYKLNGIYPVQDFPVRVKTDTNLFSWYADLQHKYYPEFFSNWKILERNIRIRYMLKNSPALVVSSHAVANDFSLFFKMKKAPNIHLYHFVSIIDDLRDMEIEEIRNKYMLPEKYFIVSNQFHRHKNHKVLLKALALLKRQGSNVSLAITGSFPKTSHSPYLNELQLIIEKDELKSQVHMLGVVPRNEQLLLMKYSQAVIQPSLFEGWSTVIEDAISLQVPVIASSLQVNIEQLGPDNIFFDPNDESELADILNNFPERNFSDYFYDDYNDRIREAAKVFIEIFK